MALLVACLIAFTRFEGTARWVVIAVGGAIEATEAAGMIWWSRRRRADTGAEALVGRAAVAIDFLNPSGRVRIDGEIWNARASSPCPKGGRVTIVRAAGLVLDVDPVSATETPKTQDSAASGSTLR